MLIQELLDEISHRMLADVGKPTQGEVEMAALWFVSWQMAEEFRETMMVRDIANDIRQGGNLPACTVLADITSWLEEQKEALEDDCDLSITEALDTHFTLRTQP